MKGWKVLARRTVLDQGYYLRVENHTVELPNGRVIPDWPWVITPDYVNVLAMTPEGLFICFRQEKYAVDGETLALVGGYLESGEDPLSAARRELLEETGYEASEWIGLGHYAVCANRGVATGHLFLARGASQVAAPCPDDLEEQHLLLLNRIELEEALANGQFKVLSWATTVALGLLWLMRLSSDQ